LGLRRSTLIIDQHDQTGSPQITRQQSGGSPTSLAHRHDKRIDNIALPGLLGQCQHKALKPGSKTDSRPVRAAQMFHQMVVPSTAKQRVLSAHLPPKHFKRGSCVVIETSDQPV
jgi:hypothetical protein